MYIGKNSKFVVVFLKENEEHGIIIYISTRHTTDNIIPV